MSSALVPSTPTDLLNPATGEIVPATPANAAELAAALRELRVKISGAIKDCEAVLVDESARVGSKTLRLGGLTARVTGGSEIVWDVEKLRKSLARAGCPEERLLELIVETVEYKVNQTVARQLAAANPKYAKAIDGAKTRHETPTRVSVKED